LKDNTKLDPQIPNYVPSHEISELGKKVCKMADLIALIESLSSLSLSEMAVSDKECARVRNEEFFPFLKLHSLILPANIGRAQKDRKEAGASL